MLSQIKLKNLLSFGPTGIDLKLGPLNVLIGPNASGKSNIIEALSLLKAMPVDLTEPIKDGGGVGDWLWRGAKRPTALVEVVVDFPFGKQALRHGFEFTEIGQRFEMVEERIENEHPYDNQQTPYFYYQFQHGHPVLNVNEFQKRTLKREDVNPQQSIVAQRRDPDQYREITYLADQYSRICLYRDWAFGRFTPPRTPQKTDEKNDQLLPDSRNLALMVNRLKRDPPAKRRFVELLGTFIEGVTDADVQLQGGTAQLFLEEGAFSVPATRLSDGTLRFMCLLVVLLNPDPPPLVCIEEPELGLHPDAIAIVGDLLIETSARTQLIVTTHSDVLLDAFSDQPESVVVCERSQGETQVHRLDAKQLQSRLSTQTLSQLWHSGEIGGNRW
ncbi:MAG: AAA family ATPase [Tepidisphaeraceae bacterium]|jgi:predicted ATPase